MPCYVLVRLRFLGKVLSVERASSNKPNLDNKLQSGEARNDNDFVPPSSLVKDATLTKDKTQRSIPSAEPIAPRLGVDYPFPPYLE